MRHVCVQHLKCCMSYPGTPTSALWRCIPVAFISVLVFKVNHSSLKSRSGGLVTSRCRLSCRHQHRLACFTTSTFLVLVTTCVNGHSYSVAITTMFHTDIHCVLKCDLDILQGHISIKTKDEIIPRTSFHVTENAVFI